MLLNRKVDHWGRALHCYESKRKGRPGLPDVERDGHHGVQHNDVAPEIQEAPVGGRGIFSIIEVPGIITNLCFPISVANGEAGRNQDEYNKDLEDMYCKTGFLTPHLSKILIISLYIHMTFQWPVETVHLEESRTVSLL